MKVSPLSLCHVCLMTGKSRLASLVLFFPPSAFIFPSFFFLFFLSSMDLPRPVASKSLFMRTIMRSKALHSVAVPRGPVAFLSLVSCPIPFRRVDERAWCTNKKANSRLFLGGQATAYDLKIKRYISEISFVVSTQDDFTGTQVLFKFQLHV